MTWQAVTHLVIALAGIGAVSALAAVHVLSGADAFTVIVGVLVGSGVLAGAAVQAATSTPSPPPVPPPVNPSVPKLPPGP